MNKLWHQQNRMPAKATLEQRIEWHREHQRHCDCREAPKSLQPSTTTALTSSVQPRPIDRGDLRSKGQRVAIAECFYFLSRNGSGSCPAPGVDFSSRRCVDIESGSVLPASVMTVPGHVLSRLLLLFVAPAFAWAQGGPESATACAKCHAEGRTQPATDMAHALESVEQARILIDHPLITATHGKYSYRIERKGDQSLYSVTDGAATITVPIRWAVGASSALGQTFILEKDGKFYESRMSWFRELNGLGPTLGGQTTHPADLNEAAGRLIDQPEKLRCFGCHATDAVSGNQLTLDKMTPGVQCGHCHEATEAHVAAMARGSGKAAVPAGLANLRNLSAEQASNFCGQCHRTWVEILMQEDHSLNNIRFQPYRLWGSLCYDPDDGRISCLACHDPHTEPSAQPTDYDAKCEACHGGGKVKAKGCPVAKANCVSCHMPKIELPGAHHKFTDHRIRIAKPDEPYPG